MTRSHEKRSAAALSLLFALLLFLTGTAACSGSFAGEESAESAPELREPVGLKYDYAAAEIRDTAVINVYEAYVRPQTTALAFAQDGSIVNAAVRPGSWVEEGETLAVLDQEEALRSLEADRQALEIQQQESASGLRLLELDLEDMRDSLKDIEMQSDSQVETARGVIARTDAAALIELELEHAERMYARAEAQYANDIKELEDSIESAELLLKENTLTAPFAGRILSVINNGNEAFVRAGETYIEILNEEQAYVQSEYIPQTILSEASAVEANIDGAIYQLLPRAIDHQVLLDRSLAGLEMYSEHDFAPGSSIPELGAYTQVTVKSQEMDAVLTIPINALYRGGGDVYVYKLIDERRERVEVEVLYETHAYAVIEEGLTEGDIVYVKDA